MIQPDLGSLPQIIVIAGAPGTGKSSLAKLLQEHSGSPLFEFGWIPEYRNRPNGQIPYEEEEQISFENLVLVCKNYLKHGYRGIILTDLAEKRIAEIEHAFKGDDYRIVTLVMDDETVLKQRVLDPQRSSGYRDWQEALAINQAVKGRRLFPKEVRLNLTGKDQEQVYLELISILESCA